MTPRPKPGDQILLKPSRHRYYVKSPRMANPTYRWHPPLKFRGGKKGDRRDVPLPGPLSSWDGRQAARATARVPPHCAAWESRGTLYF